MTDLRNLLESEEILRVLVEDFFLGNWSPGHNGVGRLFQGDFLMSDCRSKTCASVSIAGKRTIQPTSLTYLDVRNF
jgi:hypothetical protein